MSSCIYVCACVCVCICVHACLCMRARAIAQACLYVCAYARALNSNIINRRMKPAIFTRIYTRGRISIGAVNAPKPLDRDFIFSTAVLRPICFTAASALQISR